MKKKLLLLTAVEILGLVLAPALLAQHGPKGKGMSGKTMMYDPATVERIKGEVVSIDSVRMSDSMMKMMGMGKGMGMRMKDSSMYGIHAMVRTEKETIPVHLGPSWFVVKQETKILVNDKIEVFGSRITYEDKPALCAATVQKGNSILKLRNEDGKPLWAGRP